MTHSSKFGLPLKSDTVTTDTALDGNLPGDVSKGDDTVEFLNRLLTGTYDINGDDSKHLQIQWAPVLQQE